MPRTWGQWLMNATADREPAGNQKSDSFWIQVIPWAMLLLHNYQHSHTVPLKFCCQLADERIDCRCSGILLDSDASTTATFMDRKRCACMQTVRQMWLNWWQVRHSGIYGCAVHCSGTAPNSWAKIDWTSGPNRRNLQLFHLRNFWNWGPFHGAPSVYSYWSLSQWSWTQDTSCFQGTKKFCIELGYAGEGVCKCLKA